VHIIVVHSSTWSTNPQSFSSHWHTQSIPRSSLEGRRSVCDKWRLGVADAVRQWEAQPGLQELANIGALDIPGRLDFLHADDLQKTVESAFALFNHRCGTGTSLGSTGSEHGDGRPCLGRET
jgi:hypothetical protein